MAFEYTKPHVDINSFNRYTIRTGKNLPDGAVNLMFYHNRPLMPIECLMVSNPARLFNDYMSIEHIEYRMDLTKKDESVFPLYYNYFDQYGYDGQLRRRDIDWIEKVHGITEDTEIKKLLTLDYPQAQKELDYLTPDGFKGPLYLTNVSYSILEKKEVPLYGEKIKAYNARIIKNNIIKKDKQVFPPFYPIVNFPYSGKLRQDRIDAWVPIYYDSKYDLITKKLFIANKDEAEKLIEVTDNYGHKVVIPLADVRDYNNYTYDCKELGVVCDDVYINKDKIDFTKIFPAVKDTEITLEDGTKLNVHGTYEGIKIDYIGKKTVFDWGLMFYSSNDTNINQDYYEYNAVGKDIKGKWIDSYPKDSTYFFDQAGNSLGTFSLSGWNMYTTRKTTNGGASGCEWMHMLNFIAPTNSYTKDAIEYLQKLNITRTDIVSTFGIKDTYFNNVNDLFGCFLTSAHSSDYVWDKGNFNPPVNTFNLNLTVGSMSISFKSTDLSHTLADIQAMFEWLQDGKHPGIADTRDPLTGCYRSSKGGTDLAKGIVWMYFDKGVWKRDTYEYDYLTDWWPNVSANQRGKLKDYRAIAENKDPADPRLLEFDDTNPRYVYLDYLKTFDDGKYAGQVTVRWYQTVRTSPQPYDRPEGKRWACEVASYYWWEVFGDLYQKENRYFRPAVMYYQKEITQQLIYPSYKYEIYEAVYSGMSTPHNSEVKCYTGISYYTGAINNEQVIATLDNPTKWQAECIYSGVLNKSWFSYDGYARYEGIALKSNDIGNINPDGNNIIRMYCDDSGTLVDNKNFNKLDSESFLITDMFKDDMPLFYVYKLKNTIYNKLGPDVRGTLQDNSVTIVDKNFNKLDTDTFKYNVVMKHCTGLGYVYDIYLYTSFVNTFSNPLYCVYNAYNKDTEEITPTFKEQISLIPVSSNTIDIATTVTNADGLSTIVINNPNIIEDTRGKVDIKYRVETTDTEYVSEWYEANVVNINYAFPNELDNYNGSMQIISPTENGVLLTALDLIKKDRVKDLTIPGSTTNELDGNKVKELEQKTFVIKLDVTDAATNLNKPRVITYTDPNGLSYMYAETTDDTGFLDKIHNTYTDNVTLPYIYITKNNKVYPGYCIKCKDAIYVKVNQPREKYSLENWYPTISAGHFNKAVSMYGIKTNSTYKVPEYINQDWSPKYKKPYINIKNESAEIINNTTIKLRYTPVFIDYDYDKNIVKNILIKRTDVMGNISILGIKNYYCYEGIIELDTKINLNDIIEVNYTYEETCITYKGYYDDNGNFIDIDFNPFIHHTYKDTEAPFERQNTYHLFDKTVYFFINPYYVSNEENSTKIIDNSNIKSYIYHRINNNEPYNEYDVCIGEIYVKHNSSLKDCTIIDSRVRGGGVIEEMLDKVRQELEPESNYYWDIGYYDGEPYNENGVIVIRLDKRILRKYGGVFNEEDVDFVINKYIAVGVLPIVEYVDIYEQEDNPQNTLIIQSKYENSSDVTPFAMIKVENDYNQFYEVIVEDYDINKATRLLSSETLNKFEVTSIIEII